MLPISGAQESEEEPRKTYRIRSVTVRVDGRTRPEVLRRTLDIRKGREFVHKGELKSYLADKRLVLRNQRIIAESDIRVSYEQSSINPELVLVDLRVVARDTLNRFALPYAKYNQNIGLLIGLSGRDYNFLGGLEALELDLDYINYDMGSPGEKSGSSFRIKSLFAVPFYGLGGDWKLKFDGSLTSNTEGPLQSNLEVSINYDYPLERLILHSTVTQEYHRYEEAWDDPDVYYLRSAFRMGSSIPIGISLPVSREISYAPEVFIRGNYKPGDTLSLRRRGYELGFRHSLSAGRVDWIGNLRRGTQIELRHVPRYNFTRERWISEVSGEYQFHSAWRGAGFSGRAGFFVQKGEQRKAAGELLRGILNRRITGDLGVYANAELPVRFDTLFLDQWIEAYVSPFFDYALIRPDGEALESEDSWYGTGVELLNFAKFARSVFVRISLGVDGEALFTRGLSEPAPQDGDTPFELFVGIGHHY